MKLVKIGVMSLAKVQAIAGVITGFLAGIMFTLASLTASGLSRSSGTGFGSFAGFGAASIIIMPIMYGIGGFIAGIVGAWLFNLVLKITKGLEIDIKNE